MNTKKNSKLLYFDIKRDYNKLCIFLNIKGGHRQIKTSSDELTTDSLIIDSFKIIDMLGTGNAGNVYKVELNTIQNLQYALKIEYLLKSDNLYDTSSKLIRAERFDKDVASKYPTFF